MQFLSRLLKREEAAVISLAEHERIVAEIAEETVSRAEYRDMEKVADHYKRQRDRARALADELRPDAEKYRKSRSNLKQFRDQKAVANG